MSTKRKVAAIVGAGVAPLLALSLPAETAGAHGWVNSPASRQDQCANQVVQCGSIQYEPQSVEGPKGLRSCSGGNQAFAELDDDSRGWSVTQVGSSTTVNWRLTAQHATSTWQYYIGGQKIAEFNDGGAQPPANVQHQVNFGNFQGRQKVLAVWNIADTPMAFYACLDVNIGGGDPTNPDPTNPDPTNPDNCLPTAWSSATAYTGGNTVTHAGHNWRAKWWTQGEEPGTTGEWGVWEDLGNCA
jgi:chitin-binding protein